MKSSAFLALSLALCFQVDSALTSNGLNCDKYQSSTNDNVQTASVHNLLWRLLPARTSEFIFHVNRSLLTNECKDRFWIKPKGLQIKIVGTSGVAVANGLRYYLKHYCQAHVSWTGNQLQVPVPLPQPKSTVEIVIQDRIRYYQNVCTHSYSFVWWYWSRWEREIDYMALLGINAALAFTGQEYVWRETFRAFNLTDNEIQHFFTGPAFLAWNRMGNIYKWAGPLSDSWLLLQYSIGKQIIKRMRAFGMLTILPAFAGHVPSGLKRIYPQAKITNLSKWSHFDCNYSCTSFVEPEDPLFLEIGQKFVKLYIDDVGTDNLYNTDLFNEMTPQSSASKYLKKSGQAVYESVAAVDKKAIWIMQGWIFVNNPEFWGSQQAKALLTSVPKGKMLILDLQSEIQPAYEKLNGYYGQPWIWCMLNNFGGVLGLYGSVDGINQVFEARKQYSNMLGIGLTPEGIGSNDIMFHLMTETTWFSQKIDTKNWFAEYTVSRYGVHDDQLVEALEILRTSVYNAKLPALDHGQYAITQAPSLSKKSKIWFEPSKVWQAWSLFVNVSEKSELTSQLTFRNDLVDMGRESLQLYFDKVYNKTVAAFKDKKPVCFHKSSMEMLDILNDLNTILSTNENYLLGVWLKSAKSWAKNAKEKINFEFNARNQITLWGPKGEISDYATKQWAGIVSHYYYPRWRLFVDTLGTCMSTGTPFNQETFRQNLLETVEIPFTLDTGHFSDKPEGNTIEISRKLFEKYKFYLT